MFKYTYYVLGRHVLLCLTCTMGAWRPMKEKGIEVARMFHSHVVEVSQCIGRGYVVYEFLAQKTIFKVFFTELKKLFFSLI